MLLTPNPAVVFFRCFEQFEMAITRRRSASLTERLHLFRRHRIEPARDSHVLAQQVQRVDTANCGCDRQTHCVMQCPLPPPDAILDRLAAAPETLHAERRNPPPLKFRKHLLLEATVGRVKTVERHLHGIEWETVCQHLEMYCRAL